MKYIKFFSAVLLPVIFLSCDKNSDTNALNSTDHNFVINAAYANRDEIDFANLALNQSSNDSVKMYAQMMITDHTKALMSLDSLAGRYNISLPTEIDSMHAALKTNLMTLSGYSFDSSYAKGQVTDHENAITLFTNEASNGSDNDVKNFASSNLPVLQMHLLMADTLAGHFH